MRKLVYWFLLPLAVAVGACGGKRGSSDNMSTLAMTDSMDARGLQRIQTSKSETDFEFKGKDYHSLVSRTPDENLPHMTNEPRNTYINNKIVLHLTHGNETVLNRTFTENDFSSVVDTNFLSGSILEGIVYDKTTPQGVVCAASVCHPQTDLYTSLSITITADGETNIQKVGMLEKDYDDEAPN